MATTTNEANQLITIPVGDAPWMNRRRLGLFYFFARPADWATWRDHDRVPLDWAILLSLDVDPYPGGLLPSGEYFEMVCNALEEVGAVNRELIQQRRARALSHLGELLAAAGEIDGQPAVRLSLFARWAIDVARWQLPPTMIELASGASPNSNENRLETAMRLMRSQIEKEPDLTDDDCAQWLRNKHQALVRSDREARAILKVLRPDKPRGPRTQHDED